MTRHQVFTLCFFAVVLLFQRCAGIDRNADFFRVYSFAYVNAAHGRADVDLLVLPVLLFFDVDAARRQKQDCNHQECNASHHLMFSSAH